MKRRSSSSETAIGRSEHEASDESHLLQKDASGRPTAYDHACVSKGKGQDWRAPELASQATVMDLIEIYFEIVYPLFPFFHKPTFLRRVSYGEYVTDRFFFASTMAACALASARARDGAIISSRWKQADLKEPASQVFHDAARAALPIDLITAQQHDCLRAQALLALTALQNGQIRTMHQQLGRYHAMVAMDGLHDESNWPSNIGMVETEERRRLFWSMYNFDIYTAVVWNGVIRVREAHCNVLYPKEMDDDTFDDNTHATTSPISAPVHAPTSSTVACPVKSHSWLCGWNFTTDLYKVMEHAVDNFRTRRARLQNRTFLNDIFGETGNAQASQSSVLQSVMDMYANLPRSFKEIQPISFHAQNDRFGFQAANITATIQLLRMVLFSDAGASVADRCGIANEVVEAFINIPGGYLKAISTPLLHHLAGIGSILSTVYEEPLAEPEYLGVRSVLLSMAQLLSNLDTAFQKSTASDRLRDYVSRIDEYMDAKRDPFPKRRQEDAQNTATTPGDAISTTDSSVSSEVSSSQPPRVTPIVVGGPPQFRLPQDLLDDWPWVFDFAQAVEPIQQYS